MGGESESGFGARERERDKKWRKEAEMVEGRDREEITERARGEFRLIEDYA